MLGFEALSVLPISALPIVVVVPAETVVTVSGGGWVQTWTINIQWRKRQDEEWMILHG